MKTHRSVALLITLVLLGVVLSLPAPVARAAGVRYAKPSATGSGDCGSWANACTLQTALTGASSGDELWVKSETHKPGTARTDTFQLKTGVALYGGFFGNEDAREERNITANVTILSGDIGTPPPPIPLSG